MSKKNTIKVPPAFQSFCKEEEFSLGVFRGAKLSTSKGVPVIWFSVPQKKVIAHNSIVTTWGPEYSVYDTLMSKVIPGGHVHVGRYLKARLGEGFKIVENELEKAEYEVPPTAIGVENDTSGTPLVAGLAGEKGRPVCALQGYPGVINYMEPIQKICVSLVAATHLLGTAIVEASGGSVVVDMTSHDHAEIEYSVEKGSWVATGATPSGIIQNIRAQTKLQPYILP